MRSNSGDKIRLQHIMDAINEIESYIAENEYSDFMDNSMMRFACIKQMEIIGEAANHITEKIRTEFSNVEWSQIVGMRNIFVHEYFGVDLSLVWEIIIQDIPDLKIKMQAILDTLD